MSGDLYSRFAQSFERFSGSVLVEESTRTWTYGEIAAMAGRLAGRLQTLGVAAGERVLVQTDKSVETLILYFATIRAGAIYLPLNIDYTESELDYFATDATPVLAVCRDQSVDLFGRIGGGTMQVTTLAQLLADLPEAEAPPVSRASDDIAAILYTSGTTGKPKGAMLTHLNIAHSVMHFVHAMSLGESDRSIVAVPLSHVTGLVAQLYTMLHARGCAVLMTQFKAAEFARLAAAERITHTIMVPAMYNLCLLLPDLQAHDLSAWRIGAYGGASMPTATIEGIAARLPGLTLMNAYGATETCSPATIMPPGMTAEHRDSVGLAVPCGEICVVDENGNEVARGEVGEIWIAGPMVVPGYWRNPQATASEFRGGYWRSGDIGSMDADGYVRILDRKKDVINRGGYKIFCATVENTLMEHPQIVEAALVGVPCAVLGERVHAFVCVSELDERTQAAALQAFCAERLSDYAVPETWTIGTEALPRNLNGKVMKRELRQSLHAALS